MSFKDSRFNNALLLTTALTLFMSVTLSGGALAKGPPFLQGLDLTPDQIGQLPPGLAKIISGENQEDDDEDEGKALGRTVVLGGLGTNVYDSVLRFSNLGKTSGAAHVRVFNGTTGEEIASFDSESLPGYSALEIPFADILGDTEIPTDEEDMAAPLTAAITGDFNGHVQHLAWMPGPGVLSNVTACDALETPKDALGYMAGPGREDVMGMVRIINTGSQGGDVVLVLRDAASGEELGEWTSPEIASMGVWDGAVDLISEEAGLGEDVEALTLSIAPPAKGFDLSYLEGAGGALTDLTAGCDLKGGGSEEEDGEEGSGEEEGGEEEGGEEEGEVTP